MKSLTQKRKHALHQQMEELFRNQGRTVTPFFIKSTVERVWKNLSALRRSKRHHKHRCFSCRTIWSHPDCSGLLSDPEIEKVHECPICGTIQMDKYNGLKTASYEDVLRPCNDVLFEYRLVKRRKAKTAAPTSA